MRYRIFEFLRYDTLNCMLVVHMVGKFPNSQLNSLGLPNRIDLVSIHG